MTTQQTTDKRKKRKQPQATFAQVRSLLGPTYRKHRLRLLAGFIALLAVDFLQLLIPRIIRRAVDSLQATEISSHELLTPAALIVSIAAGVVILRFTWRYLIIGFSRLLERDIRNRIFTHLLTMDGPFFEKRTTGDLMAHSSNDISAIQMACGMGMVAAVDALVMLLAAIGFMIAIHPTLTLMALLPMPILAISTRILSGKLHKRFSAVQERFAMLTELSRSTLISIGLIKSYTMEGFQTKQFDRLGKKYVKDNLRVAAIQGLISPVATLVGNIGMLVVLFLGGLFVIQKKISLGDFVAFITYLYMLIWPVMAVGWVANLVQRGATSLARIHSLVTSVARLHDPKEGPEPDPGQPGFRLNNLTFSYPSSPRPVLNNLSLHLGPGIHGITGRTGCGKTTLCKLLTRLYPVKNQQLCFAGHDVNQYPLFQVRSRIGYVAQEPILFSRSIAENIRLGRPEASRKEVEEAAKKAAIHEDILTFEKGYETTIGERGIKLSGGQRQRLAMARALLADREILLIDDGLSAVDVTTEEELFHGLKHYFADKVVIVISNRTKLLSMTDRIIILTDGSVEAEGSHEELLRSSDLYRSMYSKQMLDPDEAGSKR
ncbi:ABC transporter ATP-binding protein [Desulfomarina profundi]|uniref:ABC transporter ATP-binding protein n=1 Tax=Desulfomarina profundi TaxID=2772557 RepID=UPI001E5A25D1|nr:ABC transporter ATP-binding protein [Desulfomarina profundi]